jgi:hypothetical protein
LSGRWSLVAGRCSLVAGRWSLFAGAGNYYSYTATIGTLLLILVYIGVGMAAPDPHARSVARFLLKKDAPTPTGSHILLYIVY